MRKAVVLGLLLLAVLAMTFGCTSSTRMADLTVISTKNISTLQNAKKMGTFEGSDCVSLMFQMKVPNMEEAIDQALELGKGNAMVDAVLYYDMTACATIPYKGCYRVKGTVVKTKDMMFQSSMEEINQAVAAGVYQPPRTTQKNGYTYVFLKKADSPSLDSAAVEHYDYVFRLQ